MAVMSDAAHAPTEGDDWIGVLDAPLPVVAAQQWAVVPSCGGVVTFVGTVRDHAEGRPGVTGLTYEAYEEQAVARMAAVADEARARWPDLGRLVLVHRVGHLDVGDAAVVVVASAPHRDLAFSAARFAIDAVKASVPIWKKETWAGGEGWGTGAQAVTGAAAVDAGRA